MSCYLDTLQKSDCFGCGGCAQACAAKAITMQEDDEGFFYPAVDPSACVGCGRCRAVCPAENPPVRFTENKTAFGGHAKDRAVCEASTSGGAFSALCEGWCDRDTLIFGAAGNGLTVHHAFVTGPENIAPFRKSKYVQSDTRDSFQCAKDALKEGKRVLFSGTPCQIAGLRAFLGPNDTDRLLTVEVVCEGVPTPHFIRSYARFTEKKYGHAVQRVDYRFKDTDRWDFEVMETGLAGGKNLKKDRWFNPFWSIWLSHVMSRPSCYGCPFACEARGADVTLGDLWGVHLYCPDLYNRNRGASLIVANTDRGRQALEKAQPFLVGRELPFRDALRYQSPLRGPIKENPGRAEFMRDVTLLDYAALCRKWSAGPSLRLLWQKYVWGNRQKVALWNVKQLKFIKRSR